VLIADVDVDIVQARGIGTFVWENETVVCQTDLGFGTPGGAKISLSSRTAPPWRTAPAS